MISSLSKIGYRRRLTAALICFLTLLSFFVCCKKEGFYIDELWSYGLADSYYLPYLQEKDSYMATWHEPSFYMDYLRVTDGEEAFSYGSVLYNQSEDVHPPLYYMLLHTVCSFAPGTWSKWTGLFINLVFGAVILFLVYCVMRLLTGVKGDEKGTALAAMTGYGISAAAFSRVLYIRMYQMATCAVLLVTYLTLRLLKESSQTSETIQSEKASRRPGGLVIRLSICMFFVVLAGFLTHYYFLIYLFFLTLTVTAVLFAGKKFATAGCWLLSHAFAGGLGVLFFPASLTQIFHGEKGQESFSALSQGGRMMLRRVLSFGSLAGGELFGISSGAVWLLTAMLLSIAAVFCMRCIRTDRVVVILPTFFFFVIVSVVATDDADRYLFPIYPCICICFAMLIFDIGERSGTISLALAGLMLVLQISSSVFAGQIAYLYPGYAGAKDILETVYSDAPGVYITKGDHLVINNILFLSSLRQTIAVEPSHTEEIPQILAEGGFSDADTLVLFVDIYFDEEETAKQTASLLHFSSVEKLYDNTFTQIYLLRKTS